MQEIEVRVYPLSFSEYLSAYDGDKYDAWHDYYTYGGLPLILTRKTDELKSKYLIDLFEKTYKADIIDRNKLRGDTVMDAFTKIIVVRDNFKLWRNEEGIVIMGILDFLLKLNSLELEL